MPRKAKRQKKPQVHRTHCHFDRPSETGMACSLGTHKGDCYDVDNERQEHVSWGADGKEKRRPFGQPDQDVAPAPAPRARFTPSPPMIEPKPKRPPELKLGATGAFPEGRIHKDDEGEIIIGVQTVGIKVIIEYGSPVKWVGMGAQDAHRLGEILIRHADAILARGAQA